MNYYVVIILYLESNTSTFTCFITYHYCEYLCPYQNTWVHLSLPVQYLSHLPVQYPGQHDFYLMHSKVLSNTVSGSGRERYEGKRIHPLQVIAQEPVWVEFLDEQRGKDA